MDILTDSTHLSRLEFVDTGRRRRWTVAEKVRIVEESLAGPRLGSLTARRYGLSPGLLFAWRKAHREGRLGGQLPDGLMPVVVVPDVPAAPAGAGAANRRMEVISANGWRVVVGPDFDAGALGRLLDVVERR